MANTVMAAKRLKLKNQIKKLPRQMPTGATPNRGVLNEYKERAKGLGVNEAEIDNFIRSYYKRDPWSGTGPERLAVYELLSEIKRLVPEMLYFEMIPQNSIQRLRCYFNSRKTVFVLAWDLYRKRQTFRSMEYPTRDAVVRQWNRQKVVWVTKAPILD